MHTFFYSACQSSTFMPNDGLIFKNSQQICVLPDKTVNKA